jgi:spore coat protein U-like protein
VQGLKAVKLSGCVPRRQQPRHRVVRARQWIVALVLTLGSSPCWSVCTVNVQSVLFGTYDTFSAFHLESTGNVEVVCVLTTAYTIALSPGNGSYAARLMKSGVHSLGYNLYTDATRTTIWGDGTGGTGLIGGNAISANHTIYGRVPAGQNVNVGSYSDSLIVTITF